MSMIEGRDITHEVQYWVVHGTDTESLDDEEPLLLTTTTTVPPPNPSTNIHGCFSCSNDHDTDSIHHTCDWGARGLSWAGLDKDRGYIPSTTGTFVVLGPSIRLGTYFTYFTSSIGARVSSFSTDFISPSLFLHYYIFPLPVSTILILFSSLCIFAFQYLYISFYIQQRTSTLLLLYT